MNGANDEDEKDDDESDTVVHVLHARWDAFSLLM